MNQSIQSQAQQIETQLFQALMQKERLNRDLEKVQKSIDQLEALQAGINMGRNGERELRKQREEAQKEAVPKECEE